MKTHDLAKALALLSKILLAAPNMEVAELSIAPPLPDVTSHEEIAINLHTLLSLSKINKHQWMELVGAYGFPIEIRRKDASRDIVGKVLRYLEDNPEAADRLRKSVGTKGGQASPELMKALATLLKTNETDKQGSRG